MKVMVTGAAGFIGFHLSKHLLFLGIDVFGVDNLNDYYSVELKNKRLNILLENNNFQFRKIDITNNSALEEAVNNFKPTIVVHLAAQAGVRYSLENPQAYIQSNLVGFGNILEACRNHHISHLLYASSSSVYGANTKLPFSEIDPVDHPVSLYAATKRSNELMAHSYSHLFNLPTTGLRFFTVYGPWGRPDMAYFMFTKAISEGKPITLFNNGHMKRDFTYIDDVVEMVFQLLEKKPFANIPSIDNLSLPNLSSCPFQIFNIGNRKPVALLDFVNAIEKALAKSAVIVNKPMQPGDLVETETDNCRLNKVVKFDKQTNIHEGVKNFCNWFLEWRQLSDGI